MLGFEDVTRVCFHCWSQRFQSFSGFDEEFGI